MVAPRHHCVNALKTRIKNEGIVSAQTFPVKIVDQIEALELSGRLYNPDEWGGYLMWRLGPALQVFWDGRARDENVQRDALAAEMTGITVGGRPAWESIFEQYRLDYAILPLKGEYGPHPLAMALYRHPAWRPVAFDSQAVCFAAQKKSSF